MKTFRFRLMLFLCLVSVGEPVDTLCTCAWGLAPRSALGNLTDVLQTRLTKCRLRSKHFVHLDSQSEPLYNIKPPEKGLIDVEIHWIWEFGRWVPDAIQFPAHAVNSNKRVNLRRLYGPDHELLRVSTSIPKDQLQEGRTISLRATEKGHIIISREQYVRIKEEAGNLIHARLGFKGMPIELIRSPNTKKAYGAPLFLLQKDGVLLDFAQQLTRTTLAKMHELHGDFDVDKLTVSERGKLLVGYSYRRYGLREHAGERASIRVGNNGVVTEIHVHPKNSDQIVVIKPQVMRKGERLLDSAMFFQPETFKRMYGKYGHFWATNLNVNKYDILDVGGQTFMLRGHKGTEAQTEIGPEGIVTQIKLSGTADYPPITRSTVIVEKEGVCKRAYLSSASFNPHKFGACTLKHIPIPWYETVNVAGEIYYLPNHEGQFARFYFNAEGSAETVEVHHPDGSFVARYKAGDVRHHPMPKWGDWSEWRQDLFNDFMGVARVVVGKMVPRRSVWFDDLVQHALVEGLREAISRIPEGQSNVHRRYVESYIRGAALRHLAELRKERPMDRELVAIFGSLPENGGSPNLDVEVQRRMVRQLVLHLPEKQRLVIYMIYHQGMTMSEAASDLRMSLAEVQRLHDEAMQCLGSAMGAPGNGARPAPSPTAQIEISL